MRLALIRQRYTPYGGAERFIEGALEALLERNVAITLYTREWPQTNLQLIEPHIFDPFHVGSLWRDWGFARAVCRAVARDQGRPRAVARAARCAATSIAPATACTRSWLEERLRDAAALRALRVRAEPVSSLHARRWSASCSRARGCAP